MFRRIDDLLRARAGTAPADIALIEGERTLSYGELDRAVDDAAARLEGLGVGAGDRVMVVCENTMTAPVLILAASRLNAWAAPVNARLSAREIDGIRDHSGAWRVVYTTAVSPDAAAHAERHCAETVSLPRLGEIAVSPAGDAPPEACSDDPATSVALLMYTSGTTGAPKGVMLSHANLLFMARIWTELRDATPSDRLYCVLPISHIYGIANGVLGAFAAGASVELETRFDAARLYGALAAGTTLMQGVPAMYARLLEYMETEGLELQAPALRYMSAGGAAIDIDLKRRMEKIIDLPFLNGYGLTEASPTVSVIRIGDPRDDESVGPPAPETDIRIVDRETGAEITDGGVGALWVRGPQIMLGYYRDAAATAAVLRPDGWLDTGDLARIDDTGSLWIAGRARELIIRSGFNVFPIEVEGVLSAHPDVTLVGVVGRKVPGNEEVIAFVQLAPGAVADEAGLKEWAAERLVAYKRPSRIHIMETLPATTSGKVRKQELIEIARTL